MGQEEILFRIPLELAGNCAPASMRSAYEFCGALKSSEKGLVNFMKQPDWGATPGEMENMAIYGVGRRHCVAKEGWTIDELEEALSIPGTVAILDVTDELKRVCRIPGEKVGDVDGHYIKVFSFVWIEGKRFAVVIDPSNHDIVVESKLGVLTTDCPNIYLLPDKSLEQIWHDTNIDGSEVSNWALLMLKRNQDYRKLEKYRT